MRITVKEAPMSVNGKSEHMGKSSLSALVIETNRVVTPVHGTLTCSKTFSLLGADFAMGTHWVMFAKKEMPGFNKARIEIESPAWNPTIPLVATERFRVCR
jgi:hypothetical protein